MSFNIDTILFVGFLILNLWFGLRSSHGIKTIKEYSIGDGNFNTHSLTNTIVATYIGGGFFMFNIVENYQHGLYFAFTSIAELLTFLIIGYYFAPRLSQFLGKMSIAEAMGSLYKEKVQLITAICGFIGVIGFLVLQLKVAGVVFEYVFNLKPFYGVLLAGLIVTIYSTLGGIKSVTFTDIIQLYTFGAIIPIVTLYFYTSFSGFDLVLNTISKNPNFDLSKIFDTSNLKFWNYLSISIIFLIPNFDPAIFQRISMCKNVYQIRKSFYTVFFICLFLLATMFWLCLVILTKTPNLPTDDIIKIGVFNALPIGMKGLLLVGVFAMVMSTADSYINSSTVLITYDFCKVLKIKLKNKLLSARIISFALGILAISLSFKETNILKLSIFCISFYTPIVVVPFIMATCGYRTPYEKAVLWGMGVGFITVLLWNYYGITIIDSIVPAMLLNLVVLVFMHYYYHNQFLKLQNKSKVN
jgi:Na+/proline symporter